MWWFKCSVLNENDKEEVAGQKTHVQATVPGCASNIPATNLLVWKMVPQSLNCTVSTKNFHRFAAHLSLFVFSSDWTPFVFTFCFLCSTLKSNIWLFVSDAPVASFLGNIAALAAGVISASMSWLQSVWPLSASDPPRWPLVVRHYLTLTRRVSADD